MTTRLAAVVVGIALSWPSAQGERAIQPTSGFTLAGTVLAFGPTEEPVRHALVKLVGSAIPADIQTVTDDLGQFAFEKVPPGRYSLSASKAGWLTAFYGSNRPGKRTYGLFPLTVEGRDLRDLTLRMAHGSVISGTIYNQFGSPMSATVTAVPAQKSSELIRVVGSESRSTETDDRGAYRLYGLDPGNYFLYASPQAATETARFYQTSTTSVRAGRKVIAGPGSSNASPLDASSEMTTRYIRTYYPGTLQLSEAGLLSLPLGVENDGVDLILRPAATATVTGVIADSDLGESGKLEFDLTLRPADSLANPPISFSESLGGYSTSVEEGGRFTVSNIAPGEYELVARAVMKRAGRSEEQGGKATKMWWAIGHVSVTGSDISGLVLTPRPGLSVSGRLQFDSGTVPPSSRSHIQISLQPAGGTAMPPSPAVVSDTGDFTLSDVMPGRYRVSCTSPAGWAITSAMVDNIDAIDRPFTVSPESAGSKVTIHLSDRPSEVIGTLSDGSTNARSGYAVMLFTADRDLWGTRGRREPAPVTPAANGSFRFVVPEGDYFLLVATDVTERDLLDPSALGELAANAIRVSVKRGESKRQDIRIK